MTYTFEQHIENYSYFIDYGCVCIEPCDCTCNDMSREQRYQLMVTNWTEYFEPNDCIEYGCGNIAYGTDKMCSICYSNMLEDDENDYQDFCIAEERCRGG